ncbi:hypothetical protein PR048_000597 [Dryococelus australis]|uniref:Uncharacterized protein n=1 Tax=Dryococelus australis TaxID=614101 RepID=A0ABQ9IF40_9NEOP|nr:hypothetical protein PR048_000597 [Dryococelus australis]
MRKYKYKTERGKTPPDIMETAAKLVMENPDSHERLKRRKTAILSDTLEKKAFEEEKRFTDEKKRKKKRRKLRIEEGLGKEWALTSGRDQYQAFAWSDVGKPWKAEIRIGWTGNRTRVLPNASPWESCWTIPLVGGFSRGSHVSPASSFQCRSIFTSINLIGAQDLAVKSRPNLFTHSLLAAIKERQERKQTRHVCLIFSTLLIPMLLAAHVISPTAFYVRATRRGSPRTLSVCRGRRRKLTHTRGKGKGGAEGESYGDKPAPPPNYPFLVLPRSSRPNLLPNLFRYPSPKNTTFRLPPLLLKHPRRGVLSQTPPRVKFNLLFAPNTLYNQRAGRSKETDTHSHTHTHTHARATISALHCSALRKREWIAHGDSRDALRYLPLSERHCTDVPGRRGTAKFSRDIQTRRRLRVDLLDDGCSLESKRDHGPGGPLRESSFWRLDSRWPRTAIAPDLYRTGPGLNTFPWRGCFPNRRAGSLRSRHPALSAVACQPWLLSQIFLPLVTYFAARFSSHKLSIAETRPFNNCRLGGPTRLSIDTDRDLEADLPWRSRLVRNRPGVQEVLGSNPRQGMGRWNEIAGGTGDPRENPPTNGIVWHEPHMRKSGVTRPGIEPGSPWCKITNTCLRARIVEEIPRDAWKFNFWSGLKSPTSPGYEVFLAPGMKPQTTPIFPAYDPAADCNVTTSSCFINDSKPTYARSLEGGRSNKPPLYGPLPDASAICRLAWSRLQQTTSDVPLTRGVDQAAVFPRQEVYSVSTISPLLDFGTEELRSIRIEFCVLHIGVEARTGSVALGPPGLVESPALVFAESSSTPVAVYASSALLFGRLHERNVKGPPSLNYVRSGHVILFVNKLVCIERAEVGPGVSREGRVVYTGRYLGHRGDYDDCATNANTKISSLDDYDTDDTQKYKRPKSILDQSVNDVDVVNAIKATAEAPLRTLTSKSRLPPEVEPTGKKEKKSLHQLTTSRAANDLSLETSNVPTRARYCGRQVSGRLSSLVLILSHFHSGFPFLRRPPLPFLRRPPLLSGDTRPDNCRALPVGAIVHFVAPACVALIAHPLLGLKRANRLQIGDALNFWQYPSPQNHPCTSYVFLGSPAQDKRAIESPTSCELTLHLPHFCVVYVFSDVESQAAFASRSKSTYVASLHKRADVTVYAGHDRYFTPIVALCETGLNPRGCLKAPTSPLQLRLGSSANFRPLPSRRGNTACAAGRLDGFGSCRTSSAIFGSTQWVVGSLRLGFVEQINMKRAFNGVPASDISSSSLAVRSVAPDEQHISPSK